MKRNIILDILRGLGIFCVVFAHTLNNSLTNVIYLFHMPLFFFINGLTMSYSFKKSTNFKDYILKKIKAIIIPYFIFCCLSILYWILIERNIRGQFDVSIISNVINIFVAKTDAQLYAFNIVLWFLPCLFISNIIFYFIMKFKSDYIKFFVSILLFGIGYVLCINKIILPLSFETSLIGTFFIVAGYLFIIHISDKISLKKITIPNTIFLILCIIGIGICIRFNCYVNMLDHTYGNVILFLIGSFSGIYICLFISILLHQIKFNIFLNLFSYFGKNSVIIMCCHEPIKRIVLYIFSKIINMDIEILRMDIFFSIIIVVIILAILVPIIYVINNYLSFVIGKKKIKNY